MNVQYKAAASSWWSVWNHHQLFKILQHILCWKWKTEELYCRSNEFSPSSSSSSSATYSSKFYTKELLNLLILLLSPIFLPSNLYRISNWSIMVLSLQRIMNVKRVSKKHWNLLTNSAVRRPYTFVTLHAHRPRWFVLLQLPFSCIPSYLHIFSGKLMDLIKSKNTSKRNNNWKMESFNISRNCWLVSILHFNFTFCRIFHDWVGSKDTSFTLSYRRILCLGLCKVTLKSTVTSKNLPHTTRGICWTHRFFIHNNCIYSFVSCLDVGDLKHETRANGYHNGIWEN